ncbi:MAG: AAA family ATPase [Gemmatimonadota bacterium]
MDRDEVAAVLEAAVALGLAGVAGRNGAALPLYSAAPEPKDEPQKPAEPRRTKNRPADVDPPPSKRKAATRPTTTEQVSKPSSDTARVEIGRPGRSGEVASVRRRRPAREEGPAGTDEAEISVLGAMLIASDAADQALARLGPESFAHPEHAEIFTAIRTLREQGLEWREEDGFALTVQSELRRSGRLATAGGEECLARIVSTVPTAANILYHIEAVDEDAAQRHVERFRERYSRRIADGKEPVGDVLAEAEEEWRVVRSGNGPEAGTVLHYVLASDVPMQPVEWVCEPWIPHKKTTVLAGHPGDGKSQIACDVAAGITNGTPILGDNASMGPGRILIVSGEDAKEDTLVPRLKANGANMQQVAIHRLTTTRGKRDWLDLSRQEHLEALRELIREFRPLLVVLDPLTAFLGGIDVYRVNEVRAVLGPLAEMAEEEGCAVLVIMHLTKANNGANVLGRLSGSGGFAQAVRSVIMTVEDQGQPGVRAIVHTKCTNAAKAQPTGYRIVGVTLHEDGGKVIPTSQIEWSEATHLTEADINASPDAAGERSKLETARDFLEETLAGGVRVEVQEVYRLAKQEKISDRTLQRAAEKIGVQLERKGAGTTEQVCYWCLHSAKGEE